MANVGQIIDDKYEILTLIGQGGMSKVYLARDRRLNKQWAVKEIQKKARDKNNEVVVQSAIAEANMIKQLDHPSIVRIVDIIDNPDVIYIIEDYIEGETLNTILEENGAQPQELVIEWAMQICEALEYLHTRKPAIIYRDMKPSNVMLKPDGNIKIIIDRRTEYSQGHFRIFFAFYIIIHHNIKLFLGHVSSVHLRDHIPCQQAAFRRRAGELSTLEDLDRLLQEVYEKNQPEN